MTMALNYILDAIQFRNMTTFNELCRIITKAHCAARAFLALLAFHNINNICIRRRIELFRICLIYATTTRRRNYRGL